MRALFFLYAVHRFYVPARLAGGALIAHAIGLPEAEDLGGNRVGTGQCDAALIPYDGYQHLLSRRFEEETKRFLAAATDRKTGYQLPSSRSSGAT